MFGWKKRVAVTAAAGILAAVAITGCSGSVDNDAAVILCRNDGNGSEYDVESGSRKRQDI